MGGVRDQPEPGGGGTGIDGDHGQSRCGERVAFSHDDRDGAADPAGISGEVEPAELA